MIYAYRKSTVVQGVRSLYYKKDSEIALNFPFYQEVNIIPRNLCSGQNSPLEITASVYSSDMRNYLILNALQKPRGDVRSSVAPRNIIIN